MSHFSLIVALPPGSNIEAELTSRLHPYDENREDIPEYRSYEDAETAEKYWLYTAMRSSAEEVSAGDQSSVKPYRPDEIGWSTAYDRERTEEQQWEDLQKEAEAFQQFSNPPTWPEVIEYANSRWYPEGETEDNRTSFLRYDAETDRAYTFSTYNPNSKWDYWRIGGRWARYFPLKRTEDLLDPRVIASPLSWDSDENARPGRVVVGPKSLLDLDLLRDEKVMEASQNWDKFHAFAADFPSAHGWSFFRSAVERASYADAKSKREAFDQSRTLYREQPLVQAMQFHPDYRNPWDDPIDLYSGDKGEYLQRVRRDAVPGYALLTLGEEWVAPGEMGWFGMSTDDDESTTAYKTFANEYIDGLDDDVILVVLDLHI